MKIADRELTLLENELIPIYETDQGIKIVYGTELHKAIGSKRDFSTWIKQRLDECDAVENEDFEVFTKLGENSNGGRPTREYIINLDTAKEMAMLQRNEKGKQVRRYFIEVEKRYKKVKETFESIGNADFSTLCKTPLTPKSKTWKYKFNRKVEELSKREFLTLKEAYRNIFLYVFTDFDENELRRKHYQECGFIPKYTIDLVDYFPELRVVAEEYVNTRMTRPKLNNAFSFVTERDSPFD